MRAPTFLTAPNNAELVGPASIRGLFLKHFNVCEDGGIHPRTVEITVVLFPVVACAQAVQISYTSHHRERMSFTEKFANVQAELHVCWGTEFNSTCVQCRHECSELCNRPTLANKESKDMFVRMSAGQETHSFHVQQMDQAETEHQWNEIPEHTVWFLLTLVVNSMTLNASSGIRIQHVPPQSMTLCKSITANKVVHAGESLA